MRFVGNYGAAAADVCEERRCPSCPRREEEERRYHRAMWRHQDAPMITEDATWGDGIVVQAV